MGIQGPGDAQLSHDPLWPNEMLLMSQDGFTEIAWQRRIFVF